MANKKLIFCGSDPKYLAEELTKDSNKSNGGNAFRIPSLVNANGVLVAAIDKGATGGDWGFIEVAVRRSYDNGETWTDIETIATPPAREISTEFKAHATAFFIDPVMTVAKNGDIVMLVTFFPESKGFHDKRMLDKNKIAHANHNGDTCLVIYDRDDNYYLVLPNGDVIDKNKQPTPYKVTDWKGSLYKGDEYVGNIYLNGSMGKAELEGTSTTFGAPLKAVKRSYIMMLKSSDQGKTWTDPKDVTGDVLIKKDGSFFAVCPGTGLTTQSGRIIMPLYTTRHTVAIFSDDNGETWRRSKACEYSQNIDEWSAVQAADGTIYSFGRQKRFGKTPVSISETDGRLWAKGKRADVKAPKCQKNSIVVGDTVYISHASGKKRENGAISSGKFVFDKNGKVKGINWSKDKIKINEGFFAYSCMAKIDDSTLGVLYEDQPGSHIIFETFKIK